MKTFLVFTLSLIFLNLLNTEINTSGTIEVTVTNIESGEGQIRGVLFSNARGFPQENKNAFKSLSVPAQEGKTILKFENIPYGDYALSILHDKNSNGSLDTNLFGYPQEGYGVSNNSTSTFSIPTYEEAHFEFKEDIKKILIHLRN